MLNDLSEECAEIARSKGWDEEERTFGDIIALIHSELSEALEEYRDGKPIDGIYYRDREDFVHPYPGIVPYTDYGESVKPEGIPIEFADILIRVLHYCGKMSIDIDKAMAIKMEYNRTRPHRHGGKVI